MQLSLYRKDRAERGPQRSTRGPISISKSPFPFHMLPPPPPKGFRKVIYRFNKESFVRGRGNTKQTISQEICAVNKHNVFTQYAYIRLPCRGINVQMAAERYSIFKRNKLELIFSQLKMFFNKKLFS